MKKIVEELASKAGVNTQYSGSTRVMYLRGEKAAEFKAWIKEKYPTLAFELKVQTKEEFDAYEKKKANAWSANPGHQLKTGGHLQLFSGSTVQEDTAKLVSDSAYAMLGIKPENDPVKLLPLRLLAGEEITDGSVEAFEAAVPVFDPATKTPLIMGTAGSFESTQGQNEQRPATREEVDEYLINNPIDRNAKNPYNRSAEVLRVKPDYIRGRWRSLRERGLVEKENA